MKILVTGGAGFIGTNLIKRLLEDKHLIISLDNYSSGSKENEIQHKNIRYVKGDIRCHSFFNDIDICFHLAALSRIQPTFVSPINTFNVNSMGTQMILDWAYRSKIKKVIYSGSSSRWHNPHISPYAINKYIGEELCKMYRTVYKIDVSIVRFYNVYGQHEVLNGVWAAIIGKWRNCIKNKEPIPIVGK